MAHAFSYREEAMEPPAQPALAAVPEPPGPQSALQTERLEPASTVAVDLSRDEVLLNGERVPLTGVETAIVRYLVQNCSRTVKREELRAHLESLDFPGTTVRSIDVYVGRARRKIGNARHAIATVRGGGYQFVPGPRATVRGPAEYSI